MRSNIVVNWENTMVFSPVSFPSSSSRELISLSNSRIFRILAESGGKFESLVDDNDLRFAFRVSSTQSLQCSPSLAMFFGVNLQRHDISRYTKREAINHILVLAQLAFFALGHPKLLEHLSKLLVFLVVFRGWTGFDSFTVGVVILRDERRVITSCSSCQCAKDVVGFVMNLPCRKRRSNTMTFV